MRLIIIIKCLRKKKDLSRPYYIGSVKDNSINKAYFTKPFRLMREWPEMLHLSTWWAEKVFRISLKVKIIHLFIEIQGIDFSKCTSKPKAKFKNLFENDTIFASVRSVSLPSCPFWSFFLSTRIFSCHHSFLVIYHDMKGETSIDNLSFFHFNRHFLHIQFEAIASSDKLIAFPSPSQIWASKISLTSPTLRTKIFLLQNPILFIFLCKGLGGLLTVWLL